MPAAIADKRGVTSLYPKIILGVCVWSLVFFILLRIYIGRNPMFYLGDPEKGIIYEADTIPEAEFLEALQAELPRVPFRYWFRHKDQSLQKNATCAKYANIMKLHLYNTYWQTYGSGNVSFQLYGAYFDNRSSVEPRPVVRLLALANTTDEVFPPSYCQLWYENSTAPAIVGVSLYSLIWERYWFSPRKHLFPHLLSCVPPAELRTLVPQAVSLVDQQCATATNNLRVYYDPLQPQEKKQQIAICVKGLDFPHLDMSARLVEWFELMRLLGAHKVFAYDLSVHSNVTKVLRYYQQQDFVEVQPLSLASGEPRLPYYQHASLRFDKMNAYLNELIPYNDCFYRNMYKYDYLALVDVDEALMPLGRLTTWAELIAIGEKFINNSWREKCPHGLSNICFRHVLFPNHAVLPSAVPDYMHMLQHTLREQYHSATDKSTKCFHNTTDILTVHNHFFVEKLRSCGAFVLPPHQAQLQHYRGSFADQAEQVLIEDPNILRYKESLLTSASEVLLDLGLLL